MQILIAYTSPLPFFLPEWHLLFPLFLPQVSLCLAYLKSGSSPANQREDDLQCDRSCQKVRCNLFKFSSKHAMQVKTMMRSANLVAGEDLRFVQWRFNHDKPLQGDCVLKWTTEVRNCLQQTEEIVFTEGAVKCGNLRTRKPVFSQMQGLFVLLSSSCNENLQKSLEEE